jgi:hypothetical protein
MERTVPSTASEEIELYLRTIYSLLRSTADVQIRSLEEVHAGTNSALHPDARREEPDTSAFVYSLLRLPDCMPDVHSVILGQSPIVFAGHGFSNLENWQPVSARARRRRCFFDGKDTLACFIASRSDIDDVVPGLTAYQIEWNKLHFLLKRLPAETLTPEVETNPAAFRALAAALKMPAGDLDRLRLIWKQAFLPNLQRISAHRCALRVRLLSGSLSEYWRATRLWWDAIEQACPDLLNRPVYFISSNPHSIPNLLSGYALQQQDELLAYLSSGKEPDLLAEWQAIAGGELASSRQNFLYYLFKKYQQSPAGQHFVSGQEQAEKACGILHISPERSFDVVAEVIDLSLLNPAHLDPRLDIFNGEPPDWGFLSCSNAMILNIDYPLGLAAYHILTKIAEHLNPILGVYIMGKAATLNGVRGDVIIPNVVQDEHSQNTYLFQNAFTATDVAPYLVFGTVLDNQKAVSVLGTFLQNSRVMDVVYREGYTDIEMEAGPYLSAVFEMARPQRHPVNEIANLQNLPFDLGILHYASDTPLSKGKNLGVGTLSYFGMDSTYASSVAILRRILSRERARCSRF